MMPTNHSEGWAAQVLSRMSPLAQKPDSGGTAAIVNTGKITGNVYASGYTAGTVNNSATITGNVTASEKVDIRDNGSVDGNIVAPRVAIAVGAHFRGSLLH